MNFVSFEDIIKMVLLQFNLKLISMVMKSHHQLIGGRHEINIDYHLDER